MGGTVITHHGTRRCPNLVHVEAQTCRFADDEALRQDIFEIGDEDIHAPKLS